MHHVSQPHLGNLLIHCKVCPSHPTLAQQILLPSARHLKEGRGAALFCALGGPKAPATGAWQLLEPLTLRPPWVLELPQHHQMMTQTHPKAIGRFPKKLKFSKVFKRH